ncbi:MAG: hypothetical protein IPO63_17525 [Bacteroidetes bacterium]|nr:hypothetical protein [Bacteroidota bacterium]
MRIHIILLAFLFLQMGALAQDSIKNTSILLVPFQLEYYLSDAERDIMAQTKRSPEEYRDYFRKTLDLKIQGELEVLGPCVSLLQDTTTRGRNLLEMFYGKAGYSYADPVGGRTASKSEIKKQKKRLELHPDAQTAPQTITTRGDSKFMQMEMGDTSFLNYLFQLYQSDYIVSINQFEIKTNYNSCIDIANKIYRRELLIHYSILKANGKQVRGNFCMEFFPSSTNSDREIVERTFPGIAASIQKEIAEEVE